MAEIIPAIIGTDFEEVRSKVSSVAQFVNWVQIDVVDGKFAQPESWPYVNGVMKSNVEKLALLREKFPNLKFEIHLMVSEPEKIISDWIKSGADRVYIHIESTNKRDDTLRSLRDAGISAGLAVNYESLIEDIDSSAGLFDAVQVMTIDKIGAYGRPFAEDALSKVRALRVKYPSTIVSVDGGINLETGKKAILAGANVLVAGSAILKAENIGDIVAEFKLL